MTLNFNYSLFYFILLIPWIIFLIGKIKPNFIYGNHGLKKVTERYISGSLMSGIGLLILLVIFYNISKDLIWIAPIIIYSALGFFIKSKELNTEIIEDKNIYYGMVSILIILLIIITLTICTYDIFTTHNTLSHSILTLYVIIYIYELILITLCLNPKKIAHIIKIKKFDNNPLEYYKRIEYLFIIIGCIPPLILLTI